MISLTPLLFVVVLVIQSVVADHSVWFKNQCGQYVRPVIKNTAQGVTYWGPWLPPGGEATSSVPERWASGIMVGQTSDAQGADCIGCTRLECDFANPPYQNCNLSRVAGFHIPMGFGWTVACPGATCASNTCPPYDAWNPGVDDGSSLRFCSIPNAGLNIWFC